MNTQEKYLVYHKLKKKHNIELTEEQVNTVDEVYIKREISYKGNLVYYRFINVVLSIAFFIVFIYVRKDVFCYRMSIVMTILFGFLNTFYMFLNVYRLVKYKELKGVKSE